jgi:shikimate dehydrogenase
MTLAARCAVLGSPVAHSLSPALHEAAYRYLGLSWTFEAIEITSAAGLARLLGGLDPSWRGFAVTMPVKRAALALCDEASGTARDVGAVNTLLRSGGRFIGDNTDVPGLVAALAPHRPAPVRATILGGGATATSAVAALRRLGVTAPDVVVRSPERAAGLLAAADRLGARPVLRPWPELERFLATDLVVVTVPPAALAGVADRVRSGRDPSAPGLLFDLVYDPWPTPLAAAWAAAGGAVLGGLDLLVEQAAGQLRLMTGADVPVPLLRAVGERALAARAGAP